jgi:hypothetical protein
MLSIYRAVAALITLFLISGVPAQPLFAGEPTAAERVLAIKNGLADSQAVLRRYEWNETTVVSAKGAESSRKRRHCYYDATGTLRKEPLRPPAQPHKKPGLRRNIPPEQKQEELTKEMQDLHRLLSIYLPLNPNGLQAVAESGNLSLNIIDPGKLGRLTFRDFLKRGDRADLELDLTNNRPLSLRIRSYLDSEADFVILSVTFESLYGSATFAQETVVETKENKLKMTIQNTDYEKVSRD